MDTNKAKEIINTIAQAKESSLAGGGKDFVGALKRLVGIWHDPSHAFTELLQNADDVEATEVTCHIFNDGIRFLHNGHPFKENENEQEIRGICSIDSSTKDVERHTGFMGIGFKAVFKLSDSPYVVCPPWQFHFKQSKSSQHDWGWILIPKWTDNTPEKIRDIPRNQTAFWLPYKIQLSEEARKHIETEIYQRFDGLCLMFLRNIRKITITNSENKARTLKLEENKIIENKDGKQTISQYKIFKNLFQVPQEIKEEYAVQDSGRDKAKVREIIIAFATDPKGNLQAAAKLPLYTFLPTNYLPNLRFAVQADFILDTQRAQIDESLEWNRWLWQCVRQLLIDAINGYTNAEGVKIKGFKEDDTMRYQFYKTLPAKDDFPLATEETLIQREFLRPFWDYCQKNPIIITASNTWVKPSETVLTSHNLHSLIDNQKLKQLTDRQSYVHRQVQGVKEFLNQIGVKSLDEQEIIQILQDENWISSKDGEWFQALYRFLADRIYNEEKRWDSWWSHEKTLKQLRIVKTATGPIHRPVDVLFPPKEKTGLIAGIPSILFVSDELLDHKEFLENIGVQQYNQENVIKTVILKGFEDKTWQQWTEKQLESSTQYINEWLKSPETKLTPEFKKRLGAVRIKTDKNQMQRADSCYFTEDNLKSLLPWANFINAQTEEQKIFLTTLGVMDKPRVISEAKAHDFSKPPVFTTKWTAYWEWLTAKNLLPYSSSYRRISDINSLDSWERIEWTNENSKILLDFVIRHWETYYKQFVQSRYEYFYYSSYPKMVPSLFKWQIKETPWLSTTKGNVKPSKGIFYPSTKIKKVIGELVPYINIPDNLKEKGAMKKFQPLLSELEITTELNIESLKYVHEIIQERPIDKDTKKYLSQIYKELGKQLEDENEIGYISLLTTDNTYENPVSLYWDDDHDISQHFLQKESIQFAWTPKDVERKNMENLFNATGVKAISKHVQRKLITPPKSQDNEKWTSTLREKSKHLHSLFSHHKASKSEMTGEKLSKISVKISEKIEIILVLDSIEKAIEIPILYDTSQNVLYMTPHIEEFEIAIELARAFELDFGYVSDIEIIFHENKQKIEARFQRQGISLIEWEPAALPSLQPSETEQEPEEEPKLERELAPIGAEPAKDREHPPHKAKFSKSGRQPTGTSRGKTVRRPGTPYEERMQTEETNIQRVIQFEERNNRKAQDVSKKYVGYDLESTDKTTGEKRYIEIKAIGFVMLTQNEYETAKKLGKAYYLYIVDGDGIHTIADPVNSCTPFETEIIESRWNLLNWQNTAEYHAL